MDKQFEYKGYWWHPSNPDRQVAGILTYIPNEKIELELIGDFYEDTFKFIDSISITEEDIKSIVDSRDYYSHFFKREEKPLLLDGKELFYTYVKLRVLLICCILRLIGLQNDSIKELVMKCQNHILNTKYS